MKKIIGFLCVISVLLVTLTSCVYMFHGQPRFRKDWSALMDYVEETVMYSSRNADGDRDKVYEILKNALTKEEFDEEYDRLAEMFSGTSSYSITLKSFEKLEENGVSIQKGTIKIQTGSGDFIVKASVRSDADGLSSFSVVRESENDSTKTE